MKRADYVARSLLAIGAGTVLGLAACSGPEQQAVSESPIPSEPLEVTVPDNSVVDSLSMEQMIELAKSDLAQRLDVNPGEIIVVEARAVTWRSGALGCPEPGMMYTQALVPGALLLLKVAEVTYRYHGASGSNILLCPDDRAQQPAEGVLNEVI